MHLPESHYSGSNVGYKVQTEVSTNVYGGSRIGS